MESGHSFKLPSGVNKVTSWKDDIPNNTDKGDFVLIESDNIITNYAGDPKNSVIRNSPVFKVVP